MQFRVLRFAYIGTNVCNSLAAALLLLVSVTSAFAGGSMDIVVLKEISFNVADFHLKLDPNGYQGVFCKLSCRISGLQDRTIYTRFTPRLPDGTRIKATVDAPAGAVAKDGTLRWDKALFVQDDPQVFQSSVFMPLGAMQLPPATKTIVVRGHIFSGNISSYVDAAIQVGRPKSPRIGLLIKSVTVGKKEQTYTRPNPSGRATKTPNIVHKKRFLTFSSANAVTGLKGKSLYSGVFFKYPRGAYVKPSSECPKTNIGKQGQAQFEQVERILSSNKKRQERGLKVPLEALALDPSKEHRVIAVYYISSGGLWSVRKFEILIPAKETNDNGLEDLILLGERPPRSGSEQAFIH